MDDINGLNTTTLETAYYNSTNNDDKNDGYLQKLNDWQQMSKSMSEAAKEAPLAARQQILNSLLKQCEMMNNALYTARSWNGLMKIYAKAKSLSLQDNPKLSDIKKAIGELNNAIASLEKAEISKEDDEGLKEMLPLVMKKPGSNGENTGSAASSSTAGIPASASVSVSAPSVDVSI